MRILTSDEVQQARAAACNRAGVSSQTLMHAAGYAVTQFCLANFKFNSVCIVCGPALTGGIGLVAEEPLRNIAGRCVPLIVAGDASELAPDTAEQAGRGTLHPLWISSEADLQTTEVRDALACELIIDAIAGADGKRELTALERKAVSAINDAFGHVVSIDLPTGVEPDSRSDVHQPDAEFVFSHGVIGLVAPRPAHVFGSLTSGPIAISEIGVPPVAVSDQTQLQVVTAQEVAMSFPVRAPEAHKGDFGHVLVIGGSRGEEGKAALAGLGALHAGAGLVTVACPASIRPTVAGFAPELMTQALLENSDGCIALDAVAVAEQLATGKDVVVLGPGLSRNAETAAFVRALVPSCSVPLVLDADGLSAYENFLGELKTTSGPFRALTPHQGEAARLLTLDTAEIQRDRIAAARRLAEETNACVLLKGRNAVIAGASGENWINLTGNPSLAKGGSGDVLSGMIAAALARRRPEIATKPAPIEDAPRPAETKSWLHELSGIDAAEKIAHHRAQQLQRIGQQSRSFLCDSAVAAAAHLHGLAGDIARDHLHENTVMARDVLARLSEAFRECEEQMEQRLFYLQK